MLAEILPFLIFLEGSPQRHCNNLKQAYTTPLILCDNNQSNVKGPLLIYYIENYNENSTYQQIFCHSEYCQKRQFGIE